MENKTNKYLGHVKECTVNITSPLSMNVNNMNFKALTMMCGKNGSGKSLILKLTWCISYISEIFLTSRKASGFNLIKLTQFTFDKSFDNQNFNGTILYIFNNGNSIEIKLEMGKVLDVNPNFEQDLEFSGLPCFMSAELRLYTDIRRYFQMRKALGIKGFIDMSNAKDIEKLLDMYKLYDIIFCEKLFNKLQKPLILNSTVKKSLNDTFEISKKLESIGFDENKSELYYIDDTGTVGYLTSLSNGEQALINMITTQST